MCTSCLLYYNSYLYQLWLSSGIKPGAQMGHSLKPQPDICLGFFNLYTLDAFDAN